MFNDDVMAICPDCGSGDVTFTAEFIRCNSCDLAQDFAVSDTINHPELSKEIHKTNMIAILQQWQFAG